MGLMQVQRGLARLLTEDDLRKRFAVDPQGVGQILNLNEGDTAQLATLAGVEVERFAASLRAKRWNEIQKLLPVSTRTAQQVEFPLRRMFLRFAQTYVPQGSKRHTQDALAFVQWVAQLPKPTFQNTPASYCAWDAVWLPDLLRYEAGWLEMQSIPSRRWMLRSFAYPVATIACTEMPAANEGGSGLISPSRTPRKTVVLWLRLSRRGRLRHYTVSVPVYNAR